MRATFLDKKDNKNSLLKKTILYLCIEKGEHSIAALSEAIGAAAMPWQSDRKLRAQEFRRILSGGEAQALLALIHCVLKQSSELAKRGKHLSAADDTARKDAERMLDEEFAFTLGTTPQEAGRYICERLLPGEK